MKRHEFYREYANTPLQNRFKSLSNGMTLFDAYKEIKAIDDKIRNDEIRREGLLTEAEKFL